MTYHIFIGFDSRQKEPYQIAKYTLEKHATVPIKVHKLDHFELRQQGLFTRPWEIQADGQYLCKVDNRPFSTQFSHTRFLVPELWRNLSDHTKSNYTMFVDCDFLFRRDVKEVFDHVESQRLRDGYDHPIYCIKHNYKPEAKTKMEGYQQYVYNKKLWSSLMVFNMVSPDNDLLTTDLVNTDDGRNLHGFNWIENELRIGAIPESWNFLPDHSEKNVKEINAIHYTEGGPWLPHLRNCKYADLWFKEYNEYLSKKVSKVSFNVEDIING